MRLKLLLTYLFISSQVSLAQTEKIKGTVTSNDFTLQGVEVVNLDTKSISVTNANGVFSIMAKEGDQIIFISKSYQYKTITLNESDFENPNFVIVLNQKTEELDEVVITKKITAPLVPNIQELLDRQVADDKYSQKKNPFGTDGSITYGPDFFKILKLFTKGKQKKTKEINAIGFKETVESHLSQDFFSKSLKLNQEEIPLFLEFCDADSKSKIIMKGFNELELIDFLLTKNAEFKKLQKD